MAMPSSKLLRFVRRASTVNFINDTTEDEPNEWTISA